MHGTAIDVGNVLTFQFFPPPGRYYAVVQAYNSSGALGPKSDEVMFDVLGSANQPPSLTQPANQSSTQNTVVSLTLMASDPENSPLSFSASGLPPGLAVNPSTGVIGGTVTTAGSYSVTAIVSDGALTASRTFTWTVTSPADTTAPAVAVTAPGNTATVSGANVIVTATATDAVGVVGVQFRLDGVNLAAEDTVAPYSIAWNTTTTANGGHQLTAVARDAAGNTRTSLPISVTVNNNRAPSLAQPVNQAGNEGVAASLPLSASDPDGNALTFTAAGLPAGLAVNASTGLISGTPTYSSAGTYSVTATVSDGALSASRSFSWIVTNTNRAPSLSQPANQTSPVGAPVTLSLSASDPDGDTVTFSATGLPGGLAIATASGVISGTPDAAGIFAVAVTATDGSLTQSRTFSWTITSGNRAPTLAQPVDQISASKTNVSLQLAGSDPDGTPLTYQAAGLPPGISINTSTGLISGRLGISSAGLYTVTASVSDGSLSASRTFMWSVDPTDIAVSADFDGDGREDPGTFRRSTGEWRVWSSGSNFVVGAPIVWGVGTDLPVPADYDGDNRADIAVYRPSNGRWYILLSSTDMQSRIEVAWGNSMDRPVAIDYDNDGRADLALPRAGGLVILLSTSNYTSSVTVR